VSLAHASATEDLRPFGDGRARGIVRSVARPDACQEALKWLDEDFLRSFRNDVDPKLWPDIEGEEGYGAQRGFFSITVLTLMYCTAMAGLLKGDADADSEDTIKFLEGRVGRSAGGEFTRLYAERSGFLYAVFRHRLVHQREPGKLRVGQNVMKWGMARSPQDPSWLHLRLREYPRRAFRFWVHADVLHTHVMRTFEDIRSEIHNGGQAGRNLAKQVLKGKTAAESARPLPGKANQYATDRIGLMLANPDTSPTVMAALDDLHRKSGFKAPRR
jgi:hypothetical protein